MSLKIRTYKTYTPICDTCGWRGYGYREQSKAEGALAKHPCGTHYEEHDHTGGYRGILGGYNRRCVCGAVYVSETRDQFKCPREDKKK